MELKRRAFIWPDSNALHTQRERAGGGWAENEPALFVGSGSRLHHAAYVFENYDGACHGAALRRGPQCAMQRLRA
jgi:hypothetical protein